MILVKQSGKKKMTSVLNEELIKQVFFYSDEKRPNALIADDVDVVQFAQKIEQVVTESVVLEEHRRCVKIVESLNKDVARALANTPPR
jgi:hypothetical protein